MTYSFYICITLVTTMTSSPVGCRPTTAKCAKENLWIVNMETGSNLWAGHTEE